MAFGVAPAFAFPLVPLLFCLLPAEYSAYDTAAVVDNYIIGTPKVLCEESVVALDIVTAKPFIGNIFVKGRAKDALCRQSFSDPPNRERVNSAYTLSLGKCGMQRLRSANPRGINFAVTVVVSFHPAGFITKNDRAFHLSCFYTEPDEIVTSSFEVSQLPAQELSDHMHMPSCGYSVHRGSIDGPELSWANVGDTVFHVWECRGPEMGMLVKKCFVTDGDGEDHAVVDEEGCSLDHTLLSEVEYAHDGMMRAHAKSQVFKYADSNQLFFTCQIRMCQKQMDMCRGITPPRCEREHHHHHHKKERKRKGKKERKEGEEEERREEKREERKEERREEGHRKEHKKGEIVKEEREVEKKERLEIVKEEANLDAKEETMEGEWTLLEDMAENSTSDKEALGPINGTKTRVAEKEEEEEDEQGDDERDPNWESKRVSRSAKSATPDHPASSALFDQMEVDVASPQMLVLDWEDRAQMGDTSSPSSTLHRRKISAKTLQQQEVDNDAVCISIFALPLAIAALCALGSLFTVAILLVMKRGKTWRMTKGKQSPLATLLNLNSK